MNPLTSYPKWLLRERDEINNVLRQQMANRFKVPTLATEVSRCLIAGRKIRSIIFRAISCGAINTAIEPAAIIFAIECAHAASVLVDDILDQDSFRHGYLATQTLWGAGRSALVSHILVSTALDTLSTAPQLQGCLTAAYSDACWGEAHDTMLVPGIWTHEGYTDKVSSKTSALFRFAVDAGEYLTSGAIDGRMRALGDAFGRLYQYANDYYDWQPESLLARHEKHQSWPVTFSLPLALHLQLLGDERLGDFRNATLSYTEWLDFLDIVWHPQVRRLCEHMLNEAKTEVQSLIFNAPLTSSAKSQLGDIAALASTYQFWFHDLKAA
jgi:geranylgeranyl pyrophosphate synthase